MRQFLKRYKWLFGQTKTHVFKRLLHKFERRKAKKELMSNPEDMATREPF